MEAKIRIVRIKSILKSIIDEEKKASYTIGEDVIFFSMF